MWWSRTNSIDEDSEMWILSGVLMLSLITTLPFLWYAKRLTAAVENLSESYEQELVFKAPGE